MHHPSSPVIASSLLFALLFSACQRAHTDFDPENDFSGYRTFALSASNLDDGTLFGPEFPEIAVEVANAVIAGIQQCGLEVADPESADLFVTTHVEVVPYESSADTYIKGRDMPSRKLGPFVLAPYSVTQIDSEAMNREMREGTLLVNVTDLHTHELVWQGWISQVFDLNKVREKEWSRTPDKAYVRYRQRTIQKAVKRILANFPPEGAESF